MLSLQTLFIVYVSIYHPKFSCIKLFCSWWSFEEISKQETADIKAQMKAQTTKGIQEGGGRRGRKIQEEEEEHEKTTTKVLMPNDEEYVHNNSDIFESAICFFISHRLN